MAYQLPLASTLSFASSIAASITAFFAGSTVGRRRLVNLRVWPLLQLKLPIVLLGITVVFAAIFLAHTDKAYGALLAIGLEERWIRSLVEDIRRDYFIVSVAIAVAYSVAVLAACLAVTHHLLGPIVAIQRHLARLKAGDFNSRVHVRGGHPLTRVAEDLNEIGEMLCAGGRMESIAQAVGAGPAKEVAQAAGSSVKAAPVAASPPASKAETKAAPRAAAKPASIPAKPAAAKASAESRIDQLVNAFSRSDVSEDTLESTPTSLAG